MRENQLHKGKELNSQMFRAIYHFFKFLTPAMSTTERRENFAVWHELDWRTAKKILEGQAEAVPKLSRFNDGSEYLLNSLNFLESKQLWTSLGLICRYCDYRGKNCKEGSPAKDCIHCKSCRHMNNCKQRYSTGKIPEDCKVLKELLRYIDEVERLAYIYFPIKYVLPLEDGLASDTLYEYKTLLKKFLSDEIDLKYISCVIRYAYMYDLKDCIPPHHSSPEPEKSASENLTTCLVPYSRHSLSISRAYSENTLENVLKQIVSNPIDDTQFELWKKCDEFEKDLLRSQKTPKLEGSVDKLINYAQKEISVADIITFLNHFADIRIFPLRPIDIHILKKCLCWKDYSFDKFLEKLPPQPDLLFRSSPIIDF